jgi:glucosamine--fructose-6-phosphate aminotransferase (isomerizing)
VEIASEYRYRASVPDPKALVVVISQSGETADTLSALKHAQSLGQQASLAICNVASSALMRLTRLQFLTHAGVEIGVASTKAFTTQLTGLFLLALTIAKLRGRLKDEAAHMKALRHLPTALGAVLALEPQIIAWAERFAKKEHACSSAAAALPDRARRRAQAEGDLVHPRRGLSGGELKHGRSRW